MAARPDGRSQDPAAVLDARRRVDAVSRSVAVKPARLAGKTVGRHWAECVPDTLGPPGHRLFSEPLLAGDGQGIEVHSAPLGDDVMVPSTQARHQERDVLGVDLPATGMSRPVQDKESLRASEARYRILVEASPDFIYVVDRDDRIRFVNSRAAASVGRSAEELVGALRSDLFGRRTTTPMRSGLQWVFETGEPVEVDSRVEYSSGDRWNTTWLVPMRDDEGRVEAVFGVSRDITRRKRAEDVLSRYQLLAAEARDIILFVRATDGAILEANAAAEAAYGYSREDLLRLDLTHLRVADDGPMMDFEVRAAGGKGILFETEHRRKDGTVFPVEVSSKGITVIDGREAILSVIRDISERKEAEQALLLGAARLKRALESAVSALSSAAEMRDPYTAGHQRRVAELGCAIAAELGWSEDQVEVVRTAALLHDVGKIIVPAEILSKPGRLTETEMQLIRQHAKAGAEAVADIDFGGAVAETIGQHHERLDGSGYPAGLHDGEILPEARLLAVADVVEAMISHRPYRPALTLEEALAEIESGSGTRYDAAVCSACVSLFREKGFTPSL